MGRTTGTALACTLLALSVSSAVAEDARIAPLMSRDLTAAPGKEVVLLTVEYPPGGSSSPHRHNAQTFVYVLEGSVVMQVKGGPAQTLGPGQTFYEGPEDVHVVSKNASQSKPAKFLVVFVKDKGAPPVVAAQ